MVVGSISVVTILVTAISATELTGITVVSALVDCTSNMLVASTATADVGTKLERKKLVLTTAEKDSSTRVVLSALGDENPLEGSNRLLSVVSTDAPALLSAGEGEGMMPTDDCGVVVLLGVVDDSINVEI